MNTQIEYQYRDAANYKKFKSVVIKGVLDKRKLQNYLFEGELFVPSEVGLSDLNPSTFSNVDHIWHEIVDINPTESEHDTNLESKDLETLFKDAYQIEWNQSAVFKRKGLI